MEQSMLENEPKMQDAFALTSPINVGIDENLKDLAKIRPRLSIQVAR
jgi:hypothetical protein